MTMFIIAIKWRQSNLSNACHVTALLFRKYHRLKRKYNSNDIRNPYMPWR